MIGTAQVWTNCDIIDDSKIISSTCYIRIFDINQFLLNKDWKLITQKLL